MTIKKIQILREESSPLHAYLKHEQDTVLKDLATISHFKPLNDNDGPYDLQLSIEESRLVMRMKNGNDHDIPALVLSLKPYRRIIQDYFLMIESYEQARQNATREKLEAIDMARRGIHNEGAELFMKRLKDKIDIDFDTARKFFTLICVLHKSHMRLVG